MISALLLFTLLAPSAQAAVGTVPLCQQPNWVTPAKTQDGLFHGDLMMKCKFELPGQTQRQTAQFEALKAGIIAKIQKESVIHSEPPAEAFKSNSELIWDVSHRIQEDGGNVVIREIAFIQTDLKQNLIYRTHSKEVKADGMAGFLKSVNFTMKVDATQFRSIEVEFRNEVRVERPWYAIDFIFSPIAQNICFEKMDKVKTRLLPWVVSFL